MFGVFWFSCLGLYGGDRDRDKVYEGCREDFPFDCPLSG